MATRLVIEGLVAGYGAARVLHGVTVHLEEGETVVLLGANGNGKSTLINCLMGLLRRLRVLRGRSKSCFDFFR